MTDQPATGAQETATCYRHPDREAHIRCVRCNRRICPDCMVDASVGFQCPECVREGNQGVRRARTVFGGRVSGDPGYVSKVIIAVNVVAWVVQTASGPTFEHRFWLLGGPVFDPVLLQVVGVADNEYYRLLTAAFLHGGLLHLALNMYALYLFGPPLEAALGRVRFVALYVLSALGGSALSYAFSDPSRPALGASGAVFGLLGAYLVVSRRMGRDASGVMVLLVINFVYGFLVPRIDWRAHLGGLVAGALVALVLAYAPKQHRVLVQT
ncbi:MAG: rhomboid family intramembrane serine protease, partial [Actinomycetes bacterium]